MTAGIRRPSSERREQIADAALAIIGREGFAALTTTSLAKEIGLTSGALFRHFPSREAILDETVRRAEERIEATFPESELPPIERLRSLARARVRALSREPGLMWVLRSREAALALPPAGLKRMRGMIKRSRTFIQAALEQAAAAGDVRDDVPPAVLLFTFTATVHALIASPGVRGAAGRRASVDRMLEGLFALLAPSGRPPTRS